MNFLTKVAVGAVAAYGVTEILKRTGIAEKVMIAAVGVVNTGLTKANDLLGDKSLDDMSADARAFADDMAAKAKEAADEVMAKLASMAYPFPPAEDTRGQEST